MRKICAALFALLLITGMTFDGHAQKRYRLAIVVNSLSPFWNPMTIGMNKAGEEFNCDVQWAGPKTGQITEQRRLLEQFAAQGVDGIAVSPIDEKAIKPVIDELMSNGIKVICMDNDAKSSKRLAYIGTLNIEAGKAAGKAAVKMLPEGGKVVAFVGNAASPNASERLTGFKEAIEGSGIEVVEVFQDQTDKARARRNVEDAIQKYPDLKGLLGIWSYNGPAIAQAVQSANKRDQLKIVCFDAEPQTLMHLKADEIDATVVQKPYYFGYLSVKLLREVLDKGEEEALKDLPEGNIIDTGVDVITPETVEAYEAELKELGIESS